MKVIVTSFKPFNNFKNNYSSEVLKYVEANDKIILDVVYDKCYEQLVKKFNLLEYDLIIAMGEARSRETITLETQAMNISSCSLKDNEGVLKQQEKIVTDGKDNLQTKVDIKKIESIIKLSNDAGKFVCNNLYYHLLYDYPEKSLFIHIPECHDSQEEYIKNAKVVNSIIENILHNKKEQ